MPKKIKIANSLLIIFNILIIACFVVVLTIPNKYTYSLYWCAIPLLIIILLSFINVWSELGTNSDIDKSKIVQRSFDDITTLSTVFYGAIYLVITFFDTINNNLKNNTYLIIGFFVLTLVYELFIYLAIYNAKKETMKLIEEQHSGK